MYIAILFIYIPIDSVYRILRIRTNMMVGSYVLTLGLGLNLLRVFRHATVELFNEPKSQRNVKLLQQTQSTGS